MRLLGFELRRTRATPKMLTTAVNSSGGWFGIIRESFGGAWQRSIQTDAPREILAFSAVFACVTIIASDIAKLRIKLVEADDDGVTSEVRRASPFLPVLAKPNHFQTRFKFMEQWVLSKLLYGNTFVLKQRDNRGIVTALYILDAQRVTPLIADDGSVFYQLAVDHLSELHEPLRVPASEIIHDTMVSLWHPLVGISPIYACGVSATMGNRIQSNSTKFFDNMSRPSGMLTAPGVIPDETAARLKEMWEVNYSGNNVGRTAVLGNGLTYAPMTIPAGEAQLIEQLKWTVEDVARCFHVPMWKLGGAEPARQSVESLNQTYYADCLQALIESAEALLGEGLCLPIAYSAEFDLDGLMRMDTAARYTSKSEAIKGGWMSPNEARATESLKPIAGGESPYLQQQNFSLAALAKRDAKDDPFAAAASKAQLPGADAPAEPPDPAEPADPAETADTADDPTAEALFDLVIHGLSILEVSHAAST